MNTVSKTIENVSVIPSETVEQVSTSNVSINDNAKMETLNVLSRSAKKQQRDAEYLAGLKLRAKKTTDKEIYITKWIENVEKNISKNNVSFKKNVMMRLAFLDKQKRKILHTIEDNKAIGDIQEKIHKADVNFTAWIAELTRVNDNFSLRKLNQIKYEKSVIEKTDQKLHSLQHRISDIVDHNNKMKTA